MGVSKNGWFIVGNPIKIRMMTGGTPISRNLQIGIYDDYSMGFHWTIHHLIDNYLMVFNESPPISGNLHIGIYSYCKIALYEPLLTMIKHQINPDLTR